MLDRFRKWLNSQPKVGFTTDGEPPRLPEPDDSISQIESEQVAGTDDATVYCSCGETMEKPTEFKGGPIGTEVPVAWFCPRCDRK